MFIRFVPIEEKKVLFPFESKRSWNVSVLRPNTCFDKESGIWRSSETVPYVEIMEEKYMVKHLHQVGRIENVLNWESVFISYGSPDQPFAEKLNKALTERGVKTCFFPRNAIPGEKAYLFMCEGVNEYDHTILVCSQHSLERLPVLNELEMVLSRESREGGSNRLIPVTLDRYVYDDWSPHNKYLKTLVLDRSVCDFMHDINDETKFTMALDQLLLALKQKDE